MSNAIRTPLPHTETVSPATDEMTTGETKTIQVVSRYLRVRTHLRASDGPQTRPPVIMMNTGEGSSQ